MCRWLWALLGVPSTRTVYKCLRDKGLGTCINVRECAQNTLPRVEILWGIADNIGMENYIYSVEIFEHHVGIQEYHLFSSSRKAEDFAEGYMTQQEESWYAVYQCLGTSTEDEVRIWGGSGEDVIIRRKSLLG